MARETSLGWTGMATLLGVPQSAPATRLCSPIIVVGTHRSGTTMLGRALAQHSDVAYQEEPRHVWCWGNNYRRDDVLEAADARPRVVAHIRNTFARALEATGRSELVEKTPSNCLRLAFILRVFPRARFVHLRRDGRAVIRSTREMLKTRGPDSQWFWPRLVGTPVWEWPAFAPRAYRTLVRRRFGGEMRYWGPRPPGWRDWTKRDPLEMVLAKQWRATASAVLDFRERHPEVPWIDVRYENFVERPAQEYERIVDGLGLSTSRAPVDAVVQTIEDGHVGRWANELQASELSRIRPVVEPTLRRLGYEW